MPAGAFGGVVAGCRKQEQRAFHTGDTRGGVAVSPVNTGVRRHSGAVSLVPDSSTSLSRSLFSRHPCRFHDRRGRGWNDSRCRIREPVAADAARTIQSCPIQQSPYIRVRPRSLADVALRVYLQRHASPRCPAASRCDAVFGTASSFAGRIFGSAPRTLHDELLVISSRATQ